MTILDDVIQTGIRDEVKIERNGRPRHVPPSPRSTITQFDPLLASADLPYSRTVYPLGFPVHIKTNDVEVLQQAELSWPVRKLRYQEQPIEIRILVSDAESDFDEELNPPVYRAQKNLMTAVTDAQHFAVCDLGGGFGFACTSKRILGHDDFFRYHFLEGIVYSLLDTSHLATMHSACVSQGGRGVLLVGESGAGKSSFAYACARRGWTFTSDDATSLILKNGGRTVLGNPNTFRFRPSVAALFPELSGHVRERNYKPTMEIRTDALSSVVCRDECFIEYVIFLNRQSQGLDGAKLTSIPQSERYERLYQPPWPVEIRTHAARRRAIETLSHAPGFELAYKDFGPAIDLLDDLISTTPKPQTTVG